jgi:hypothetical protein
LENGQDQPRVAAVGIERERLFGDPVGEIRYALVMERKGLEGEVLRLFDWVCFDAGQGHVVDAFAACDDLGHHGFHRFGGVGERTAMHQEDPAHGAFAHIRILLWQPSASGPALRGLALAEGFFTGLLLGLTAFVGLGHGWEGR